MFGKKKKRLRDIAEQARSQGKENRRRKNVQKTVWRLRKMFRRWLREGVDYHVDGYEVHLRDFPWLCFYHDGGILTAEHVSGKFVYVRSLAEIAEFVRDIEAGRPATPEDKIRAAIDEYNGRAHE